MPEITIDVKSPHWRCVMQTSQDLAGVVGISGASQAGNDARAEAGIAALGIAAESIKTAEANNGKY
ncbi:MAG: hypothetical protein KZQ87_03260 [Candidatus Thiodiazotropha sp. (ex Cardiolucina cf. quadrata)]|nr:hypothetical protein [Candidatus Thiodiazotropha sp. (ex Cardiolucina cf. quadrata)]